MSLLPFLYSNYLDDVDYPLNHWDHRHESSPRSMYYYLAPPRANQPSRCPLNFNIHWPDMQQAAHCRGLSTVKPDKDQFNVSLDVQHFKPEEINVKVVDRSVIVEGHHEEKQDEHGYISRNFTRRYMVPESCDIEQVSSKLSSDGVLSITVPRKDQHPKVEGERKITIEHTGKPAIHDRPAPQPKEKEVEKKTS